MRKLLLASAILVFALQMISVDANSEEIISNGANTRSSIRTITYSDKNRVEKFCHDSSKYDKWIFVSNSDDYFSGSPHITTYIDFSSMIYDKDKSIITYWRKEVDHTQGFISYQKCKIFLKTKHWGLMQDFRVYDDGRKSGGDVNMINGIRPGTELEDQINRVLSYYNLPPFLGIKSHKWKLIKTTTYYGIQGDNHTEINYSYFLCTDSIRYYKGNNSNDCQVFIKVVKQENGQREETVEATLLRLDDFHFRFMRNFRRENESFNLTHNEYRELNNWVYLMVQDGTYVIKEKNYSPLGSW